MSKPNGGPAPPKEKISLDGGGNVSVWENWRDIPNTNKKKLVYSITIQTRRYQDPQTREWKSAPSFSPAEAAAVAWAIGKALDAIIELQRVQQENQESETQDPANPAPF